MATHIGPRDKRITLYVKDFKNLGASGSGNFGVAPQAIEGREETKDLLNKLADLRNQGLGANSEQSATASPIRSQYSTQTFESGNNQDSQVDFATQVPRSNAPVVSKPRRPDPTATVSSSSTPTANTVKSLAPPTKKKHGNPLANTLSSFQIQAAPQRPSVGGNKALLGVIQNLKHARPAPELASEPTSEQQPGRVSASLEPAVIERETQASREINLTPDDDNGRRAHIETQKRKRQSPDETPRKKAADVHDLHEIDKDLKILVANHDPGSEARFGAAVTEASTNTLRSRPVSRSVSDSAQIQSDDPLEAPVHSFSKLVNSASGQHIGQHRISSRDVNIPKDQEALLNRADGKSFCVTLIPTCV